MKKNDELSSIERQRILLACCNIRVSGTRYRVLSGMRYHVLVQNALQHHGNFGIPLAFPQCSISHSSHASPVTLLLSVTVAVS